MGDLLDTLFDVADIYSRYGLKGCLIFTLIIVLIIGAIIGLALMLQ